MNVIPWIGKFPQLTSAHQYWYNSNQTINTSKAAYDRRVFKANVPWYGANCAKKRALGRADKRCKDVLRTINNSAERINIAVLGT